MATAVLSIQTRLLGNATYANMLRTLLGDRTDIRFVSAWSDEQHQLRHRTLLGRLVHRACFTYCASTYVRQRNADFKSLRYELGTSYWARQVAASTLRTFRADVLHFHTQALSYASLDLMEAIPTVLSADLTSVRNADQNTLSNWRWTHAGHHRIEGLALRRAVALAPFSDYAARSMVADYGVDEARVHVIRPGVDLRQFEGVGEDRPHRSDTTKRILFVGGEFERKGGDVLISAFRKHLASRTDVELHIVTQSEVEKSTHPRIFFHNNIVAGSPAWRRLYNDAYVFVMPTRREAYGFVYLEAAAARLPVIGSTVGAGPELIVGGETGFLVEPGATDVLADRLVLLLDNPVLAKSMGRCGRARVERDFDAVDTTGRMRALFESVAARELVASA